MKESFDDILRNKWAERQFPIDEDHRHDMIDLLNAPKQRRRIPIWWFGGLLILMSFVGYYFLAEPQVVNQPSDSSVEFQREILAPTSDDKASAIPTEHTMTEEKSSAVDVKASSDKHEGPTVHHSLNKTKANQTTKSEQDKLLRAQVQPEQPDQNLSKKHSRNPNPSIENEVETKATELFSANKTFQENNANTSNLNGAPALIDLDTDTEELMISIVRNPGGLTLPCPTLPLHSFDETVNVPINELKPIMPHLSGNKPLSLFLETGVGMILASKPFYESGWKFRVGGGLGYKLNSKFQMSLSAGYLMQQGGFDFQRSSTVSRPGFGLRSSFNSLNPERLHFVYSKIGGQYRMQRHILAAHGGIQWLYGAQGDIVIQSQDQLGTGSGESTQYAWLSINGLRKANMTADFSYGYQLTPRLAVQAGTDIYFSSFTVEDVSLSSDGYYWKGRQATLHPFITFNYQIYGNR